MRYRLVLICIWFCKYIVHIIQGGGRAAIYRGMCIILNGFFLFFIYFENVGWPIGA